MFLLSLPEDSFGVIGLLRPPKISLPAFSTIVYGYGMELPAFTLARGYVALSGEPVKLLGVYDFTFLDSPYTENSEVVFFVNDEAELKDLENVVKTLGIRGTLLTCGGKKFPLRTQVFEGDLCEINLALSTLSWLTKFSSPRSKHISEELDTSDLKDWISSKLQDVDPSLDLVISPVLLPSITLLKQNLGKKVKPFYEKDFSDSNVLYTGVDSLIGKRVAYELRNQGKRVKEVLLDTDPLTAPIYLSIMSYIFKIRTKGS